MRKLIMAIILGSTCCVAHATTKTIWVDGVDKNGGWYDVNKTSASGDDNLCWAATATNLITWWQDKYEVPEGIPNTDEQIWTTFKENVVADIGGDPHGAILWWISGVYTPTSNDEAWKSIFGVSNSSNMYHFDGYYYEYYNLNYYNLTSFVDVNSRRASMTDIASIGDNLLDLVSRGCGVGISIRNDENTLAHALTLWGIEYDDSNNQISKLWLTDSDDAQYSWVNNDGLFSVDVTENNDRLYITTTDSNWYDESRNAYIDGIFAVNPKESDTWGIPLARSLFTLSIPEPSTAALSLLALAGLAARRRRGTY